MSRVLFPCRTTVGCAYNTTYSNLISSFYYNNIGTYQLSKWYQVLFTITRWTSVVVQASLAFCISLIVSYLCLTVWPDVSELQYFIWSECRLTPQPGHWEIQPTYWETRIWAIEGHKWKVHTLASDAVETDNNIKIEYNILLVCDYKKSSQSHLDLKWCLTLLPAQWCDCYNNTDGRPPFCGRPSTILQYATILIPIAQLQLTILKTTNRHLVHRFYNFLCFKSSLFIIIIFPVRYYTFTINNIFHE